MTLKHFYTIFKYFQPEVLIKAQGKKAILQHLFPPSGRFSGHGGSCVGTGAGVSVLPGPRDTGPYATAPDAKNKGMAAGALSNALVWGSLVQPREDETARTNEKLTRTETKPSNREAELCMCPGVTFENRELVPVLAFNITNKANRNSLSLHRQKKKRRKNWTEK